MPAQLRAVHTIPVYEGMSPLESYFHIVNADGEAVATTLSDNVAYWANIGVFQNTQGEVVTMVLSA